MTPAANSDWSWPGLLFSPDDMTDTAALDQDACDLRADQPAPITNVVIWSP